MKKLSAVLILCVAALTFSCSSDSSSSSNDDTYVNFKVNGTQYNIIEPGTFTSLNASVVADDANRTLILRMPDTAVVGTYAITDASPSDLTAYTATYSEGADIFFDAVSGSITISNVGSEYMTGTFNFTGTYDGTTYTITEGTFRAYKPEATN
ncbi:MAG TPA: DUF6252 family protein [Flavobacterium sp.]|nr:DUF6252 family protein [Flavobacterium sp.]